jgi:hypothetical protein
MSARHTRAASEWYKYQREVDKHFIGRFDGVGREMAQVNKGIQKCALAARETLKNVGTAKECLSGMSKDLASIDILVAPIVMPQKGNF